MAGILVLLSGGLDSTTVAALAKDAATRVGGISFDYGQKHREELKHAAQVAAALHLAEHVTLDLTAVFSGTDSALLDRTASLPQATYAAIRQHQGPSPTYVPLRNSVLMTVAGSYALIHDYDALWLGVHADDAHHDAYPDCRPDAIGAIAAGMHIGSYYKLRVAAPLQYHTKAEVVKVGLEVGAPLELTRSCYAEAALSCGTCPTCRERLHAFAENGVPDPIRYAR